MKTFCQPTMEHILICSVNVPIMEAFYKMHDIIDPSCRIACEHEGAISYRFPLEDLELAIQDYAEERDHDPELLRFMQEVKAGNAGKATTFEFYRN